MAKRKTTIQRTGDSDISMGSLGLDRLIAELDRRLTTSQSDQYEFLKQIRIPGPIGNQLRRAQTQMAKGFQRWISANHSLMAKESPPAESNGRSKSRKFPETTRRSRTFGPDGRVAVLDRPIDHRRITDTNRKDMMLFPAIAYGLAARIATVVGAFASWSPECDDPLQRALVKAQLEPHLHKLVDDSLHGALVYGFSPFELVWENNHTLELEIVEGEDSVSEEYTSLQEFAKDGEGDGASGSKPPGKSGFPAAPALPFIKPPKITKKVVTFADATVLKKAKDLNPVRTQILVRGPLAEFAGLRYDNDVEQELDPLQSFVVTHNGRFGQMYGASALDAVYSCWYIITIVTQLCNMYLERRGDPPYKGFAPLIGSWDADGNPIEGVSLLTAAINAMRSSFGVVLPSDVDPQSGKRKYDLEVLAEDPRVEIFIRWIEHQTRVLLWGLLVPDGAVWQSSRVGSFAASQTFADLAVNLREIDLRGIEGYLNKYVVPRTLEMNFASPRPALIQAKTRPDVKIALVTDLIKRAMDVRTAPGQLISNMVDWKNAFKQVGMPTV